MPAAAAPPDDRTDPSTDAPPDGPAGDPRGRVDWRFLRAHRCPRRGHFLPEATMTQTVLLLNGPNLNLLGQRQPEIYGRETLADIETRARDLAGHLGLALRAVQSNHEGALVDAIQAARTTAAAIIINPGAYSHTSIAILDALNAFDGPVVEVHLSNIHRREAFRHHSHVSGRADGVIAGLGAEGYMAALRYLAPRLTGAA
jgi:3-dehydroquinate dehydratase-2